MTLTEAKQQQQYERYKAWKLANPERYKQQQAAHYQQNKQKRLEYSKNYYKQNWLKWKTKYQK